MGYPPQEIVTGFEFQVIKESIIVWTSLVGILSYKKS